MGNGMESYCVRLCSFVAVFRINKTHCSLNDSYIPIRTRDMKIISIGASILPHIHHSKVNFLFGST